MTHINNSNYNNNTDTNYVIFTLFNTNLFEYFIHCATIRTPLKPIVANHPFEIVAMDYIGPIGGEPTTQGNRYILVFTDLCTKWVEAVATPDCTAETTAIHLFNLIITRHGSPKKLLSDCGLSFLNKTIENITEIFTIKKINTTPYHPQTDGLVERFNKTIVRMLKAYVEDYHVWWDQYIDCCLFAYRMSKHASTKFSPYYLIYVGEKNYGDRIRRIIMRSLAQVRINNNKAREQQTRNYNKELTNNQQTVKTGDFILIKNQKKAEGFEYNKFMKSWIGPFKVIEVLSPQTIKIQLPIGSLLSSLQSLRNFQESSKEQDIGKRLVKIIPKVKNSQNGFSNNQKSGCVETC
ncbi:hypothetical protein RB653_007610 [Dictyostelium firmibasis]|uniref:Integrase catalytic domain-containing protein n=1 Tax=Dictyostelium firmibasis TaxID=79012 RepID=A0AAN7YP69_9MYCE